jgi:SAM-dependent methyltransferase
MFTESAAVYDAIYSRFKDYDAEAARLAATLNVLHPSARTILDVACGTGEHARLLASKHGFAVDGLDLNPAFAAIAQQKCPAGRFVAADMAQFALRFRYDVITCLFSSIGYLQTLDRVRAALACFREHLAPGGLLLLEPWFPPGSLTNGFTVRNEGSGPGYRVLRTSRTEISGRLSRLHMDYLYEDAAGRRTFTEVHELGLFTLEELLACFAQEHLATRYDPGGLTDRGLFIAGHTVA